MPSVKLAPTSGGYRTMVTVAGSNLIPFQPYHIFLSGNLRARMQADANGAFSVPLEFPAPTYEVLPPETFTVTLSLYDQNTPVVASAPWYFDGSGQPYTPPPVSTVPPKGPAGSLNPLFLIVPLAVALVLVSRRQ